MDETLKRLIENENNAKSKLEFSVTEIEYDMNMDIIESAKILVENYIKYKKAEEKYNKSIDKQRKYYEAINSIN